MSVLGDLLNGLKDIEKCSNLKPKPQTEDDKALMYTTRTETDGNLQVYEGALPAGMNGVFYVIYPVGSVNSGGLPFPQTINGQYNSEYATPIMNGDGMVLSIAFNGSNAPAIKSRIIKPPCYFADYNTRDNSTTEQSIGGKILKFSNFGISRMSMAFGARNLLNTAVVPVRFKNSSPFLLSTYDVGRPFILDPLKLKLQSPLGASNLWQKATPSFLPWVFPVVQTTAHPSFDAITQELFSVNYCKSSSAREYLITERTAYHLQHNGPLFEEKFVAFAQSIQADTESSKVAEMILDFLEHLDHNLLGTEKKATPTTDDTSVWLMRWKGDQLIEKWMMLDAQGGNAIQIDECMHQTSLTKDYIVLTQTAFKFALDLLINNPFPNHPCIDILIRHLLATAMLPYTDCYIVKRTDLLPGGGKVIAHKVSLPSASQLQSQTKVPQDDHAIPCETIHYSCDYQNPGQKVTLYGMHNSSSCVAEWIRPYDTAQLTGQQVDTNLMGMFALGSMDVNRIGKWVIDCSTFQIDEANSKQYYSPGSVAAKDIATVPRNTDLGPNTWTLGLYTFRDMISATKVVDKIKYFWYIANGADPNYLTSFIHDLYKDAEDRILTVDEVLAYTKTGIPQTLVRMNCDSMQPDDHYQFEYGTYIRSTQFIPKPASDSEAVYETDGYLFCTMQVPVDSVHYRSEYWIFDPKKISSGPLCKLFFKDIQFCFTLHSTWMESAKAYDLGYDVDVKEDYNEVITSLFKDTVIEKPMLDFFQQFVYNDWYKQKNS